MEELERINLQGKIPHFYVPFNGLYVPLNAYIVELTVVAYKDPTQHRHRPVYIGGYINLLNQDAAQISPISNSALWKN